MTDELFLLEGWRDGQLEEAMGVFGSVFAAITYADHLRARSGHERVVWVMRGADGLSGDDGRWVLRRIDYNPAAR